jgi:hypothetical protein
MHAISPAFPVHLTVCCMINILPRLYYPSVSLLPDLSHAMFLLSNCRPVPDHLLPCLCYPSFGLLHDPLPALPRGGTTRTGEFKCREVKTGLLRKRLMHTGSSGTLICWKSGQTTFFPLWDRMEGAWLWTQYRNECINVPISKLRIETKPKRFGVFQIFFFKKGTFLFISKTLKPNQNVLLCSRIF